MRVIITILIVLVLVHYNANGQTGFQTFLNYNSVSSRSNEFATDFIELADSSVCVPFFCANLNQVDTLGYAKTYVAYSFFSKEGRVMDTFRYSKNGNSVHVRCIESFNDPNNYLMVGYNTELVKLVNDTIGANLLLIKVNQQGDTVWTKTISFSDGDELPSKLIKTNDGGFAIVGQSCDKLETNCDMFLLKLDSNANEQWHKTYAWDDDSWEYPSSVIETKNGDYILLAGIVQITNNDTLSPLVIKTNSQGTIIWKKKEDTPNFSYAYFDDVVEWNNSTLFLCGSIGNSSGTLSLTKGWLMKIDSAGNSQLVSKIGQENQYMGFYNIIKQKDKIIVQGESDNFGVAGNKARPVLYSLDSNFKIDFTRVYSDSLNPTQTYIVYKLKPTSDGGFAMVGFGDDPKRVGNNQDVWFLKVDSNGCLYQPCLSVGIEQVKQQVHIKFLVFPQPALDIFQIETDFDYQNVELLQMNGSFLQSWVKQEEYVLSDFATGVYLLRLKGRNNQAITMKFIIGD